MRCEISQEKVKNRGYRMTDKGGHNYYISQSRELSIELMRSASSWRPVLIETEGEAFSELVIAETLLQYQKLIPFIPYIGGDQNHLTGSLIDSIECLAFYRAMQRLGRTAAETGKVLYDTALRDPITGDKVENTANTMSSADRTALRKTRAMASMEHKDPLGYVYSFLEGRPGEFDYGYDFWECATEKFYRYQDALEFLPFFCFLDFPKCERRGLGLSRSQTLGEGGDCCDFRFTEGGQAQQRWPPPFLEEMR